MIDDGSEDATAARAAAAGAAVVSLPFNLGIGGAVQTGFKYALEHGYDTVIRLDGDGQHDPQEIPHLLAPLARGEADVVVGSRFADGTPATTRPPFARRAGIRWFAHLVSLLTRQKLTDTTSGFQARERPRDPALRRRLPARLPRGGGGGDGRPPPAAASSRSRRGCAAARPADRRSPTLRSLYYAIKVTLALLVGIFRRRVVPLEEG